MRFKQAGWRALLLTAVFISFAAGWLTGRWTGGDTYTIVAEYLTPAPSAYVQPAVTAQAHPGSTSSEADAAYPININTCSAEELMLLPSIGETRAQKIIEYRLQRGAFYHIADIMEVSGIGQAIFDQIRGLITVGDP